MNNAILSIKNAIIEDIKSGATYRAILKKYPELKSTSMIHRIKKTYIDNEIQQPKKLSEKTKKKIMIAALKRRTLEKSDLIIENHINILETFKYSIKNLEEIQQLHKRDSEDIFLKLNELVSRLDKFFEIAEPDEQEELNIRSSILYAASKVLDIHKNSLLRIKAIDSLRGQMDSYLKFKVDLAGLEQINILLKAFVEGTGVLSDEEYFRYKKAVIDYCEFARVFFDKWDAGVYNAGESAETGSFDRNEKTFCGNNNEQE